MVVYNCGNCGNDLREQKKKFLKEIENELKSVKDKLKDAQSGFHPGSVSLYWLGYSRALEWAKANIQNDSKKKEEGQK